MGNEYQGGIWRGGGVRETVNSGLGGDGFDQGV